MKKRPLKEFQMMGEVIRSHPNADYCLLNKGSRILVSDEHHSRVVYIEQGQLQFILSYGDRVLFHTLAPVTLGAHQIYTGSYNHYAVCDTNVKAWFLEIDDFKEVIETKNMWRELLIIICYLMDMFDEYQKTAFLSANAYDIVKFSLEQIWSLPEQERSSVSVFNYIMKRHSISRSSIAKIIHSLNVGGYIETKRGVLLHIRKMPHRY